MNERIQDLKRQASIWCDQNIPDEFDENTGGYGYHWEEKFAELIVNECLAICEDLGDKGLDGHYCADKIARHFRAE